MAQASFTLKRLTIRRKNKINYGKLGGRSTEEIAQVNTERKLTREAQRCPAGSYARAILLALAK